MKINIKTTLWDDDTFIIVIFYSKEDKTVLESLKAQVRSSVCVRVGVCLRRELAENLGCIYCAEVCFCCRLLLLV